MNLQDEIKALKRRISELEQQVEQEKEFPQDGDEYWCIGDWLVPTRSIYEDDYTDRGRKYSGNIYKTEEQAEFAVEKLKVEAELRKFSRPFEPDSFNHYIFLDADIDCLDVDYLSYCQSQGTIHFESKEKAQQAIDTVGADRIKKYLFGVED